MMRRCLVSALVGMAFGGLAAARETAGTVAVIRGNDVSHPSDGVLVMRPAQGSFLRETTRLAAEAEAREKRAAAERARSAELAAAQALEALANAAYATQSRFHDDFDRSYVWVMNSRPVPVRANITLPPVAPMISSPP